jgi:hypothetical protein
MASYSLEGLMEGILAGDDVGRWLAGHVEFLVVPFVDKDGVEEGDQGKNRRPHDHNRDYGPGVSIYTCIEVPYANARGRAVTGATAWGFGRDLARALRRYLEEVDE